MAETRSGTRAVARWLNKQTAFGEPLWVDALKTLRVGVTMALITVLLGGALALMMIAPWGRASHDCSMWCVLEQEVASWFTDEPS